MAKAKKSDAIRTAGPPPAPVSSTNIPIGVAPSYTADTPFWSPGGSGAVKVKPRYYPGAQNTEIAGLAPEDRAQLQIALKQLGLITKTQAITLGVWDATSANAFKQVLAWANTTGADWKTALADMQQSGRSFDQTPTPTQTKEATNALDVKALGDQTGLAHLGRGLSPQESSTLTADFQTAEAPYLMSDSKTSEPNAQGWQEWAKTKVRNFDPVNFDAHKVLVGVDVLSKMLGSGQ